MTVRHEYMGVRSYQVPPTTSVEEVKRLLYEDTDLPVNEQRLSHSGRGVSVGLSPEGEKLRCENVRVFSSLHLFM